MEKIRVSAKTKDEAITKALIQLHTTSDRLSYHVLVQGTGGLFGIGAKPWILEASVKEEQKELERLEREIRSITSGKIKGEGEDGLTKEREEKRKRERIPESGTKRAERREEGAEAHFSEEKAFSSIPVSHPEEGGRREEKREEQREVRERRIERRGNGRRREERDTGSGRKERFGKRNGPDFSPRERSPYRSRNQGNEESHTEGKFSRGGYDPANMLMSKPPSHVRQRETKQISESEVREADERALSFLRSVLLGMGMEVSAESEFRGQNNELYIELKGPDMGILIGKRGQTLDSLQYICSLVVNREHREDYIRVKLDTEDYRKRREQTLRTLARNIAYRVKKSRKPVSLEPMNPYERRIIHAALQNDRFAATKSEGDEPFRHVVIYPKASPQRDWEDRGGREH